MDRFWWTKRRKRPRGMTQGPLKIQDGGKEDSEVLFEGGGAGGNEGDIPLVQSPISKKDDENMERSKPLAEELLDTVLDLLSFSGFTIPTTYTQAGDSKVTMAIWYTHPVVKLMLGKLELGGTPQWERRNLSSRTKSRHYDFFSA